MGTSRSIAAEKPSRKAIFANRCNRPIVGIDNFTHGQRFALGEAPRLVLNERPHAKFFLVGDQISAGFAPGCPEIEQNHFAVILTEFDRNARRRFTADLRRLAANLNAYGVRIAATGGKETKGQNQ